jgi:acyl carrier protein
VDFDSFKNEFLIACDFIEEPIIEESTRFDQIADFDSLAMLGVIVLLETKFSKQISGEAVMKLETVKALYEFATK